MANDLYTDVGAFHSKFGLDTGVHGAMVSKVAPNLLPLDVQQFRTKFMLEELDEFAQAYVDNDLAKAADALVDLVYVAMGTAHLMGLDFNQHWRVVQVANMLKERATGADDPRSTRPHVLNVVKPAGWVAPDHAPILAKTVADHYYVHVDKAAD